MGQTSGATLLRSRPSGRSRVATFGLALLCALATTGATAAEELTYLVHQPSVASAHPPMIVLLHGAGADENDLIGLWRDLPPSLLVISPRAPFHEGGGYRWYRKTGPVPRQDDLLASRKIVDLVVANAAKRFDADPTRIFLAGFSQGGVMTYEVALREPGKFRGAAALSGLMFAPEREELASAKPDLGHEAFFVGHGGADPVIPFSAATSAHATLNSLGVPTVFHAYPSMTHTIGPEELKDLAAWLAQRLADESR